MATTNVLNNSDCKQNLFSELEKLLRMESAYCTEDGVLLKNSIVEAALALRPELIAKLLTHPGLKRNFFTEIEGVLVFDKIKFQKFVMNKRFLPDSYTSFKNKIGLTNEDGDFLSESREIVLSWPYKDCILEGGQTKEDAKRNEVFWNEILAPDEINRLTEPKVLTNFRRHDADGEHDVDGISMEDNLIIKGNNLLALHSLKKKYAGKVKLIYIDPPYYFNADRDEDTFKYNSNFKLSTWLTFMRNRLFVARELLSDDGAIFVQINDDGIGELHCLMKDIFNINGENNFINKITIKTKSPSGFASVNPGVFETAEYILGFAKNKRQWKYNPQYTKTEYDKNYKWYITNKEDGYKKWNIVNIFDYVAKLNGYTTKKEAEQKIGKSIFSNIVGEFALDKADNVFRYSAIANNAAQDIVKLKEMSCGDSRIYKLSRKNHYDVFVSNGQEIAFYSKKVRLIDGVKVPSIQISNIWTDVPYEGIAKEGKVTLKGGKKPEKLLRRIIEMSTEPNDLILDYHAGSGTTAAVALKLNRRFITMEQLDYGKNDNLVRLKNVINGDTTGISKSVNWQGGGSFVYCELAKANQQFADDIEKASSTEELAIIWKQMQETGFLSWKVNPKEIDANAEDFTTLAIEDRKRFLIECLDKNLLYVPYSEINNAEYAISESDKTINNQFYQTK